MFNCANLFNTTTKKLAATSTALGAAALTASAYGYSKEEGGSMGPGALAIGSLLMAAGAGLAFAACSSKGSIKSDAANEEPLIVKVQP